MPRNPNSAKAKGDALESSLEMIERSILQEDPSFLSKKIKIIPKKIIRHDRVRHEIDLWVEIGSEADYDSLFIFECKDWKRKVGKNEIIIFNHKIEASGAQRGFFVASSFTSDATQQAKQFPRLRLSQVRKIPSDELPNAVAKLHALRDVKVEMKCIFDKVVPSGSKLESLEGVEVLLHGRPTSARDFVAGVAYDLLKDSLKTFGSGELEPGTYPHSFSGKRSYEEGELSVDGEFMRGIRIEALAEIELVRASIVSSFEVEKRGRAYTCEIASGGNTFQIELSQTMQMFRREQESGGDYMRLLLRQTVDPTKFKEHPL